MEPSALRSVYKMWCLVRTDRYVWSSGGMMISKGNEKKLGENLFQTLFVFHESDMKSPGVEPRLHSAARN
jgi:hypothetical protein